ncbi:hypothetical protein E2C01_099657 [Portunus trituberculatus]|uniref:Uncharacterized protein n=1 Tax=Portunus trituberculatus TaxID=210409 RepID=A0A5B7K0V8_PORTR|nr:hypothetical protein [Portunus trituberculatus]
MREAGMDDLRAQGGEEGRAVKDVQHVLCVGQCVKWA